MDPETTPPLAKWTRQVQKKKKFYKACFWLCLVALTFTPLLQIFINLPQGQNAKLRHNFIQLARVTTI